MRVSGGVTLHASNASRSNAPLIMLDASEGHLNLRLYRQLRDQISSSRWPPGIKLPGSRVLAADLGVSRNTALLAIEQLIADGLAESRSRSGVYVTRSSASRGIERTAETTARAPLCFDVGRPVAGVFPAKRWGTLRASVWNADMARILNEAPSGGDGALRAAIASRVCPARGIECSAEQVFITTGIGDAIDILARLAAPQGRDALVEDPGDPAIFRAVNRSGMRPLPVPADRHGVDLVRTNGGASKAAIALFSRGVQFPTGGVLSARRRAQLIDWAAGGGWLVEHDCLAGCAASPSLFGDARCQRLKRAYIGRLDRLLFASLSLGFVVVPENAVAEAEENLAGRDTPSFLEQRTLASFIDRGWFSRLLREQSALAAERRTAMTELLAPLRGRLYEHVHAFAPHIVAVPKGDAGKLAHRLRESEVIIKSLADFGQVSPAANHLLIGYAPFDTDHLREGIGRLAAVLGH